MFSGAIAAAAWLVTFIRIRLSARGRDDLKNDKWLREIMGKSNKPIARRPFSQIHSRNCAFSGSRPVRSGAAPRCILSCMMMQA